MKWQDREVDSLSSTIQVSLNVIDMKDMAPVWTKQVPIINVQEELSIVSLIKRLKFERIW